MKCLRYKLSIYDFVIYEITIYVLLKCPVHEMSHQLNVSLSSMILLSIKYTFIKCPLRNVMSMKCPINKMRLKFPIHDMCHL